MAALTVEECISSWARDVEEGNSFAAHEMLIRLVTLIRAGTRGLDGLAELCDAAEGGLEHGKRGRLTSALLRQLSCFSANNRGGKHARKYPLTFGLRLRWDALALSDELNVVLQYWRRGLERRRLRAGSLFGQGPVTLQVQARFMAGFLLSRVHPEIVRRYDEWEEEHGIHGLPDDTLCWMFNCAHVQTLWVTAQGTALERAGLLHPDGTKDPCGPAAQFLADSTHHVQAAWFAAVDEFLADWCTDDAKKLALPPSQRFQAPWIARGRLEEVRKVLNSAFRVEDPLEAYAAYLRQSVQHVLHDVVDCTFYGARPSGVLAIQPQKTQVHLFGWSTTPRPDEDLVRQELWPSPAAGAVPAQPLPGASPLSKDVGDALWLAVQQYWDGQGDPYLSALPSSEGELSAIRSYGTLPVGWGQDTQRWVLDWMSELPTTVLPWWPLSQSEGDAPDLPVELSLIAVPPAALLSSANGTRPRDGFFERQWPSEELSFSQALFGKSGSLLVNRPQALAEGYSSQFRRPHPRSSTAYSLGPDVAYELGLATWCEDAFSEQGQALLASWFKTYSPFFLQEPLLLVGRSLQDTSVLSSEHGDVQGSLALAQWLAAPAARELNNHDFAWTLAEVLNADQTIRVSVDEGLQAALDSARQAIPRESHPRAKVLQQWTLGQVCAHLKWGYLDTDCSWALDLAPLPHHSLTTKVVLQGLHIWARESENGLLDVALALNVRTLITLAPGQRQTNSVELANGTRLRTVDATWSYRLPLLPGSTNLEQVIAQWSQNMPHASQGKGHVEEALVLLMLLSHFQHANAVAVDDDPLTGPVERLPLRLEDAFFKETVPAELANGRIGAMRGVRWRATSSEPVDLLDAIDARSAPTPAAAVHSSQVLSDPPAVAPPAGEGPLRLSLQHRLHLGQLLRNARKSLGFTAHQVAAEAFGLAAAHASVCRMERGCQQRVPLSRLRALLEHYGLDLQSVLAFSQLGQDVRGQALWHTSESSRGARLRAVREALGMSAPGFVDWADVPGLELSNLKRFEDGDEEPKEELLQKLCTGPLGNSLNVAWLLAEA